MRDGAGSTVGERAHRSADIPDLIRLELSDAIGQQRAPNPLEIVERRRTLDLEAVVEAQADLGRDAPDRPGDRCDHDPGQHGHGLRSRHHQHGASLIVGLGPPDLALVRSHQGSSAIISAVDRSIPPSSSLVWGIAR